jgi:hypothetical protein
MPQISSSARFLVYGDQTTAFPWIADTAWSAPINYTPPPHDPLPSHDIWRSYVWDRAKKGFTALLVAPANDYLSQLPANGAVPGFRAVSGCQPANNSVEPNECTYWDASYWQNLDQMVKAANDAGLVVVVAGLIDPMDRSGTNTNTSGNTNVSLQFPTTAAATVFSRNLASRLANRYVIFSPGFDDWQTDPTADGKTAKDSMNAVGTALKLGGLALSPIPAVPRHLVVEHLAGGSPFSDYDLFQGQPWLSFQLFQSGHGASTSGATPQCPATPDATAYSICRAREIALHFRCMGDPSIPSPPCPSPRPTGTVKPAANSEAAYEKFSNGKTSADSAAGVRNTAYATGLSGSIGFTLGVEGIYMWDNPAIYSDSYNGNQSRSDNDLSRLASLFRGAPWTDLIPRHNLIVNNPTVEEQRMVLAGSSTYAILYAPNLAQTASVTVNTTAPNALPGLVCRGSWSMVWFNPRSDTATSAAAKCTAGSGSLTFSAVPNCTAASQCDWVLQLAKTTKALDSSAGIATTATNDLISWAVASQDGSTSDIMGQLLDADGNPVGDPITVNSDGETFGKLPTAAINSDGNFLVAWQTELPDGTLDTISARWLDANGNPLGDTFQTAVASDGQQAEPSLSGDAFGNVLVTWTAYAADGSTSGIFLQAVPSAGAPTDSIMPVNDPSQLDASSSQVQASAQGSAIVAWNATYVTTGVPGVFFQHLNPHGKPVGLQRHVGHQNSDRRRLVKLAIDSPGNFRIRWESFGPSGDSLGIFEQHYHSDGSEDGAEAPVTTTP